jgi:hypothetical protein
MPPNGRILQGNLQLSSDTPDISRLSRVMELHIFHFFTTTHCTSLVEHRCRGVSRHQPPHKSLVRGMSSIDFDFVEMHAAGLGDILAFWGSLVALDIGAGWSCVCLFVK